jgi:hypothetical protein
MSSFHPAASFLPKMSFYSSLTLFYPGTPPSISGVSWRRFAGALRSEIGIRRESNCTLHLKWGERIDQDYDDANAIEWDHSGVIGTTRDYPWDIEINNQPWESLWQAALADDGKLYRSYLSLGQLTPDASQSIGAAHASDVASYFAPDYAAISANPVCPVTLDSEEMCCAGLVEVSFSGYGSFSWSGPFADYASQYREAPPVVAARKICRQFFPVIQDDRFDRVTDHLGEIFLNRDYYEEGDWILSIIETG